MGAALQTRAEGITLRPYQLEAIEETMQALRRHHSALIVLFVGAGKTEIMVRLVLDYLEAHPDRRAVVVADKDNLVWNPYERFQKRAPHLADEMGVIQAEQNEVDKRITFASIPTLANEGRLEQLLADEGGHGPIGLWFTDEAHRAVTPSHRKVFERVSEVFPNVRHVGCTATPERNDGVGLADVFETVTINRQLDWGVTQSYLTRPRWMSISTGVKWGKRVRVNPKTGEFVTESLVNVLDTSNYYELIVETHQKYASERTAMAFVPRVFMAEKLAAAFREAGFRAVAMDGSTPRDERRMVHEALMEGELDIVCCTPGLLGEGYDLPRVGAIHMAFPCASKPRYIQTVGRGLRKTPLYPDCLILDYTPIPEKGREMVTMGNVLLGEAEMAVVEQVMEEMSEEGETGFITGFIFDENGMAQVEGDPSQIIATEVNFLKTQRWHWQRIARDRVMVLGLGRDREGDSRSLVIVPTEDVDIYRLYAITNPSPRTGRPEKVVEVKAGSFEEVTARAEEIAEVKANPHLALKGQRWHDDPASTAQRKLLKRLAGPGGHERIEAVAGRSLPKSLKGVTKGDMSGLISIFVALNSLQSRGLL